MYSQEALSSHRPPTTNEPIRVHDLQGCLQGRRKGPPGLSNMRKPLDERAAAARDEARTGLVVGRPSSPGVIVCRPTPNEGVLRTKRSTIEV
eukprot:5681329-Pyramimonas_sp.AAC.1